MFNFLRKNKTFYSFEKAKDFIKKRSLKLIGAESKNLRLKDEKFDVKFYTTDCNEKEVIVKIKLKRADFEKNGRIAYCNMQNEIRKINSEIIICEDVPLHLAQVEYLTPEKQEQLLVKELEVTEADEKMLAEVEKEDFDLSNNTAKIIKKD